MKKISKYPSAFFLLFMLALFSCGQISQKEQRKKLTFLYQLKNFSSVANEYTQMITYKKDIPSYKTKIENLRNEAGGMTVMVEWERSFKLRSDFTDLLKENIDLADSVMTNGNLSDSSKIDYNPSVMTMKKNLDNFLEELETVISKTDKES